MSVVKELLDAYASAKSELDAVKLRMAADKEILDKDFKNLWDAIKDKVTPVNNGRIADQVVAYIKKLEENQEHPLVTANRLAKAKKEDEAMAVLNGQA